LRRYGSFDTIYPIDTPQRPTGQQLEMGAMGTHTEHAALTGAISTVQFAREQNQRQASIDLAIQALENVGSTNLDFSEVEQMLTRLETLTWEMHKRPGMRGMKHVVDSLGDALHQLTLAQAAYNCSYCNGDGCGACFGTGVSR
jgi:hypothetical protein